MTDKGVKRPYIHLLSNASVDVTGSMHLVRFKKFAILLDCGMIQGGDIVSSYKANREQIKKIKPQDIDYIILSHQHIDHSGIVPALFAKGCNAHVYVPMGSLPFLKLLWADSLKIMQSDCLKIESKHGIKAPPYYTEQAMNKAIMRCIEVNFNKPYKMTDGLSFTYYHAGHIIHSAQILLEMQEGSVIKRVGFTGDVGSKTLRPYTEARQTLPFCNLLIGENTYNEPARVNSAKDRDKDIEKIATIVNQANKILMPCFSLGRTQELLTVLWYMWRQQRLPEDIQIYLDSPLAIKFCELWPEDAPQFSPWSDIMKWENIHFIRDYTESVPLQMADKHCIILAASGFLQGGRIVSHLKTALPNSKNHIIFCGFSGENNLASQIKSGQKEVNVDGVLVKNRANITDLRSFSSHASYEELMDYYSECRFDKVALVHGRYSSKVTFCQALQDRLYNEAKSSKVVCVAQDQKIYL